MYDEIKRHKKRAMASEWTITFMWLTVGAGLGAFGGAAWAVIFGIPCVGGIAYLMLQRR